MLVYKHSRLVALWLIMCAALVASMVLVGGYTRLSGSGLSITEWKPIHGAIPPLSEAEWQEEFDAYKTIPQYEQVNKGMSLDEFKGIFWPEFWHRLLGRVIGVVFLLPLIFFTFTASVTKRFAARLLMIFALGGLQGFMGWYMVSSGLTENIYVSHFRLAAHLALAFAIFGLLVWAIADVLLAHKPGHGVGFRFYGVWFALLCLQILYGALVAGLHAGLLYNSYPAMNGMWLPPELFDKTPLWLNLFENHTTVQFIHRKLAIFVVLGYFFWWYFNRKSVRECGLSATCIVVALVIGLQFLLGVLTLVNAVPLYLALKHQMTALLLFGVSVFLYHRIVKSCR